MTCPHCSAAGLTFTDTPPRAFYNGEAIDLPPGQLAILRRLAVTGSARFADLHSEREALRVQIHNLRARLPVDVRIVAVKGWGYEVRVA